MTDRNDLRMDVMASLRKLITHSLEDGELLTTVSGVQTCIQNNEHGLSELMSVLSFPHIGLKLICPLLFGKENVVAKKKVWARNKNFRQLRISGGHFCKLARPGC